MYSLDRDHTAASAAARAGTKYSYQACETEKTTRTAASQAQVMSSPPRRSRPRRRHSASAAAAGRRSSTTVVATDVGNFRAMVQELTGFPPAVIFRPLPRRAHAAAAAAQYLQQPGQYNTSSGEACGGGSSSSTSPDVPAAAAVQPLQQCATPGVFDGLADLGSPGFDHAWPDLSFEQ